MGYISVAEGVSSTTFTQRAPKATEISEIIKSNQIKFIRKITAITLFKVIQSHRFWYQ